MHAAPFDSEWRNWTRDCGRSWSLDPVLGYCPGVRETRAALTAVPVAYIAG